MGVVDMRMKAARHRRLTRAMQAMGTFVLGAAVLLACAPPAKAPTISFRLRGGPKDASVTIDDLPVGSLEVVRSRGVALPPGVHHVTILAPGHLPFDRRIEATSAPVTLEVIMVPTPD